MTDFPWRPVIVWALILSSLAIGAGFGASKLADWWLITTYLGR